MPELFIEMVGVGNAALEGDFLDGKAGRNQQLPGRVNAAVEKIALRSPSKARAKAGRKIIPAQSAPARQMNFRLGILRPLESSAHGSGGVNGAAISDTVH